ncbi:uncharacterized protein NPIL_352551 [Nephila pilipes]|uniref:Uncharacterized protein n=1 Tax=Nephila pilipes TaxID=299642 RepID=A0A8X6U3P8_NEPPI|nr:uncharacterized protein NPIL_352551 [Nephila pilipes]
MNLNSKHSTYSIPVIFPDQTEDIRNIEVTANKALKNIQNLYNEIMTPKIYPDVEYELCASDNSSESSASSNVHDRKQHTNATKQSSVELCDNCRKVISYCTSSHKRPFCNGVRNDSQVQGFCRKPYHQERSNSYPQEQQFRRDFHHRKQSSANLNKQYNQKNFNHIEQSNHNIEPQCQTKSNQEEQSGHYSTESDQATSHHHYQKSYHQHPHNGRNSHDLEQSSHHQAASSLIDSESNSYGSFIFQNAKHSKPKFKITIPKPFSLTVENVKRQEAKELKISKLREEFNYQIEKELNVKFAPKPVPKHVHLPLYGEMIKKSEMKKTERKEKCIEILNEKTKPFNLSTNIKSGISKSKSTSNLDESNKNFKAKPIPKNILSESVSQNLKNKEEIRKLLIAQRAEEMLRKSSLPFSPKPIPRSHSLFSFSDCPKNSSINVTKQTIEAITKRLYTVKCQETIENWNSKVLQNDLWSNESKDDKQNSSKDSFKKKHYPKSALPFNNFPVRMTTGATLRDNRIRADIEMRKRREDKDETIREEIARRRREILKNIWPRLKSIEPSFDPEKDIEEKVKSFRASQKSREKEYEKELQEMMKRVSKQFLLIERQSKEKREKTDESSESDNEISDKESDSDIESNHSDEAESSLSAASEKTNS